MIHQEAVVEGTLKPDGTLELDQKPNLSPGRVKVVLLPAQGCTHTQRGLAEVIDDISQSQRARGHQGRSIEEIESARTDSHDVEPPGWMAVETDIYVKMPFPGELLKNAVIVPGEPLRPCIILPEETPNE